MIDFGFDKIALIGAVALIVIGPEKLPRVARTVGHMLGKAQRYMADVKAEVSRSIELEELQKMRSEFEGAARDVEQSVRNEVGAVRDEFESRWSEASSGLGLAVDVATPEYKHPNKRWRVKRAALPAWYKQRQGIRSKALSGAARVARFRPKSLDK